MERTQIIALSLGAAVAVGLGVIVWQGLLPGLPPLRPGVQNTAPNNAPANNAPLVASQPAPAAKPTEAAPPSDANKSAQAQKPAETQPAETKSAAATPTTATAPAAKPQPIAPQFDTVRVEPSGETVVAGHGEPTAEVALTNGNADLAATKADPGGDFVIVPQPLAPGTYVLGLRSQLGNGVPVRSQQTITVSVPAKGQKGVVVALNRPGAPSRILTDPTAQSSEAAGPQAGKAEPVKKASEAAATQGRNAENPPGATSENQLAKVEEPQAVPGTKVSPGATPSVVIKTAEVDKGGFYAAGLAPPGTHVRIYLNNSALADVTADADGHWSLTVGKGMTAGHYVVRADALDGRGKVVARAEVPFDVPLAVAEAEAKSEPKAAAAGAGKQAIASGTGTSIAEGGAGSGNETADEKLAAAPQSSNASHAVVPEISTATVVRGDSLWRISRKTFGHGIRYTLIYQANASQIRDPNLIYPGQVFVLPHVD